MLSPPKTNKETESPYVRKNKEPYSYPSSNLTLHVSSALAQLESPSSVGVGFFLIAEVGVKDF